MNKLLFASLLSLVMSTSAIANNPRVWMETNHGPIILELDVNNAPIATENFLAYVNEGFYDGLIFHRVIEEFMIQSGTADTEFQVREPNRGPIQGEPNNGLLNVPGKIAMALSGNPPNRNSGRNQFYINTDTNSHLDADFTVFGEVIFGMDAVTSIERLKTWDEVGILSLRDIPMDFAVIQRAAEVRNGDFPIMAQHTGSWFNHENTGVGFNFEVARNDETDGQARLVVYWYDFSADEQLWLIGNTTFEYGEAEVTLDLWTWDGMGEPSFQQPPAGDNFYAEGTLTLRFDNCTTAHVAYQTDTFGSGEIPLSRITLPEGGVCEGM